MIARTARPSTGTRSTSAPSRSAERRGRATASQPRVRRAARSSTRSSSARPRAGAEVRDTSPSRVVIEDGTVVGIRGHGPDGKSVVERARIASAPTVATRTSSGGRARAVQRQADADVGPPHLLERSADRQLLDDGPDPPAAPGLPDERRLTLLVVSGRARSTAKSDVEASS